MEISNSKRFKIQRKRTQLLIEFTMDKTNVHGSLVFVVLWLIPSFYLFLKSEIVSTIIGFIPLWAACHIFYLYIFILFSKIRIHVNEQNLTINIFPIPWKGSNITIPPHTIDNIFVEENIKKRKGKIFHSYHLMSKLINGDTQKLLDSFLITK